MSTYFKIQEDIKHKLTSDLENWMTNLPQELKLIPIIYLSIPDADEILQSVKFLGPIIKYFMANWSKTQTYMATDQLTNGVRYFDLRIATKADTKDLFFVHGLYSDNVQTVFNDINTFLENHPQEVVILDCQHFYAFTDTDHERLMQMFAKTFGSKLLPYSDHMDFITLDYMTTQHRYQVIGIYRSDAARFGQPLLWPSQSFPSPWADTVSIPDLLTALDNGIRNRSSSVGFISQCVLTPSFTFILKYLFSTLKERCAVDFENSKLEWISKQKPGKGGMNIIISDYIDLSDCDYVKKVIELNLQLISDPLKCTDSLIIVDEHRQC